MTVLMYYDPQTYEIIKVLPEYGDASIKASLYKHWSKTVDREMLLVLSKGDHMSASEMKKAIGHSLSTIHDCLARMERSGLVKTEISYEQRKKKIITPLALVVAQNAPLRSIMMNVLSRGIWINQAKMKQIIGILKTNPERYFSVEEIAAKTGLPIDEVHNLLEVWESTLRRAVSDILKEPPVKKKVLYRCRVGSERDRIKKVLS